jgi:hypothetical protein
MIATSCNEDLEILTEKKNNAEQQALKSMYLMMSHKLEIFPGNNICKKKTKTAADQYAIRPTRNYTVNLLSSCPVSRLGSSALVAC